MSYFQAEYLLYSYPNAESTRLADVYDDTPALQAALNLLFPGFEYPDHSHKTVARLRADYDKRKAALAEAGSVYVLFPGGRLLREVILGDLQEQMFSIHPLGGDLLIEYVSMLEVDAMRERLHDQVPMQLLTRQETQALVQRRGPEQ